jgi:hypothetical protein
MEKGRSYPSKGYHNYYLVTAFQHFHEVHTQENVKTFSGHLQSKTFTEALQRQKIVV